MIDLVICLDPFREGRDPSPHAHEDFPGVLSLSLIAFSDPPSQNLRHFVFFAETILFIEAQPAGAVLDAPPGDIRPCPAFDLRQVMLYRIAAYIDDRFRELVYPIG